MLIVSDTHFTSNPRDDYRWGIFPWLRRQAEENGVEQIVHCGDLTDSKDRHSADLVNRLITEITELGKYCDVFLLCGNHDGIDLTNPFFGFVERFETNVTFIYKITHYWLKIGKRSVNCLFLPCTRNYLSDWQGIDFNQYQFIYCHQTFDGAKSETGIMLDGIPPSVFADFKGQVISGDIHVPQRIAKNIEYVGSPYRIRFGDTFNPRVILLDDFARFKSLNYPCLSKHTLVLTSLGDLEAEARRLNIIEGDQVKIRVKLPRSQFPNWDMIKSEIKEIAVAKGWELYGPELHQLEDGSIKRADSPSYKSNDDIVRAYGEAKKFTQNQIDLGVRLLSS